MRLRKSVPSIMSSPEQSKAKNPCLSPNSYSSIGLMYILLWKFSPLASAKATYVGIEQCLSKQASLMIELIAHVLMRAVSATCSSSVGLRMTFMYGLKQDEGCMLRSNSNGGFIIMIGSSSVLLDPLLELSSISLSFSKARTILAGLVVQP